MTVEVKKQMENFWKKQQKLFKEAQTSKEQAEVVGFWIGFLNGLKMSTQITKLDYDYYYDKVINFVKQKIA